MASVGALPWPALIIVDAISLEAASWVRKSCSREFISNPTNEASVCAADRPATGPTMCGAEDAEEGILIRQWRETPLGSSSQGVISSLAKPSLRFRPSACSRRARRPRAAAGAVPGAAARVARLMRTTWAPRRPPRDQISCAGKARQGLTIHPYSTRLGPDRCRRRS